jgi:hypothetical protein
LPQLYSFDIFRKSQYVYLFTTYVSGRIE